MTELGIGIVAARARARRLGTSLILLFLLYRLLLHGRRLLALLLLLVFAHEEGTTKRSGQRPTNWRDASTTDFGGKSTIRWSMFQLSLTSSLVFLWSIYSMSMTPMNKVWSDTGLNFFSSLEQERPVSSGFSMSTQPIHEIHIFNSSEGDSIGSEQLTILVFTNFLIRFLGMHFKFHPLPIIPSQHERKVQRSVVNCNSFAARGWPQKIRESNLSEIAFSSLKF